MLKEHGNWIDCCKVGVQGHNITDETASNIQLHPSGVRYILVIEKEGIFNRLSEDKFFNIIPCVIVTARGYPDLYTRKIVKKLQDVLQVPVLGLVDYNPHGLRILLTYKFGSVRMGLEAYQYSSDVKWLGMSSEDIQTYGIPSNLYQPFTDNDIQVAKSLKTLPFINSNLAYNQELDIMLRNKIKVELEALNYINYKCFSHKYLVLKILNHSYI